MPTFKIDKLSDEENRELIVNWWKAVVKYAEEHPPSEEVLRAAERVICETVCTDKIKIEPEALKGEDVENICNNER